MTSQLFFKELAAARAQSLGTEPRSNRGAKSLLSPVDDVEWKMRLQRFLEKVFGDASADLQFVRHSARKVCHLQIEKGASRFQAVQHARAINLRQDSVLQVELCIELQGAIDEVVLAAGIPSLDCLGVEFLEIDPVAKKSSDVVGFQRPQPYGIPVARWVTRATHAALNLEIHTQIRMGYGKTPRQGTQGAVQRTRDHARIPRGHPQTAKGIVSSKQLIAAISSERHGHMLSRESAEEPRRKQGIVTLWLIQLTKYSRQHIACFLKIQDLTPMIGPKKLRRPLRIGGLIEAWFGKSNAESAKPFGADMLGCQGRHRSGVDPAAEKNPQRNICH